jgi:hypothetical protein
MSAQIRGISPIMANLAEATASDHNTAFAPKGFCHLSLLFLSDLAGHCSACVRRVERSLPQH